MFSFSGAARVLLKALPGARAVRSLFVRDRDGTVAYLDEVQAAVSAAAAADALTVHRAGSETVTGAKSFTALMDTDARRYFPQTAANDSLRFRRLENLAGFHNNTSSAVGTMVVRLPNTAPNVFFGLRFRLWEYSGRGITTVEACGYIRSTIAFDNTGASSTDVVRVRYVRFARDPAGYWCLLLSNYTPHTSSTWGYPHGQIESIDLGWAGSNDSAWNDPTQYTVSLITDETGYVVYATTDMQGQVGAATGYNDALNAYMLDGITAAGFAPVAHVGAGGTAHAAATTSVDGFMSAADKTKLDGVAANANNYSLPTAAATVLGGVKVGSGLAIDGDGVLSASGGSASPLLWSHGWTNPAVTTTRTAMLQGGNGSRSITGITYGSIIRSRLVGHFGSTSSAAWTLELQLAGSALFPARTGLPVPAGPSTIEIECESICIGMTAGDARAYMRTSVKITITPDAYGNSQSVNLYYSDNSLADFPTSGDYAMYGTMTSGSSPQIDVLMASVYKFK